MTRIPLLSPWDGDSRAAAEWSKSAITPRDKAHVVESSDDLQIELLGAQVVALVSMSFLLCNFYSFLYFYAYFIS